MNKKIMQILLVAAQIIYAAQPELKSAGQKTQYVVRNKKGTHEMILVPGFTPFSITLFAILNDLNNPEVAEAKKQELLKRFAIMTYINDAILDCFKARIAHLLQKDIRNAVDAKEITDDLTTRGSKKIVEAEYQRNPVVPSTNYKKFEAAQLNASKAVVENLIRCTYINALVELTGRGQIPIIGSLASPVYITADPESEGKPKFYSALNRYFNIVEEAVYTLSSNKTISAKREIVNRLEKDINTLKIGATFLEILATNFKAVVDQNLYEQEEAAKTLVLPTATQPSASTPAPGVSSTPQDLYSLSIALRSVAA